MTYNIGLFIAVVLGYVLGALLMSHIPDNYASMLHARAKKQAFPPANEGGSPKVTGVSTQHPYDISIGSEMSAGGFKQPLYVDSEPEACC